MYGGIEAGSTKFVCAVGSGPEDIRAEDRFPATTPDETIARAIDFFQGHESDLAALGIASFGPVDPDPRSPRYGFITTTPKPGWAQTDILGVRRALNLPVGFDTDVNGAALGEHRWGAAQGLDTFVYLTIGTGIGGGVMNQQQLFPLVRKQVQELLNGYVQAPEILERIDTYIVPPALEGRAGVLGAIALAAREVGA